MATFMLKIMLLLPLLFLSLMSPKTVIAEFEQWCIADEQAAEEDLQAAMDWACGNGGADCTQIQENQPCYFPNTLRDHASYAFNSYFQKFKNKGGSCYFRGAGIITEPDPNIWGHDPCMCIKKRVGHVRLDQLNELLTMGFH